MQSFSDWRCRPGIVGVGVFFHIFYVDDVACRHSTTGGGGQRQLGSRMDFEFLSVVGHSSQ